MKGNSRLLVVDGSIDWSAMRKSHISRKDLHSALRSQASLDDLTQVAAARLERSGDISVIKKEDQPRVMDIDVQEGVQTVRIVWG